MMPSDTELPYWLRNRHRLTWRQRDDWRVTAPGPDFERRLTRLAAGALSVFFVLAAVGIAVMPLGTSGDDACGMVVWAESPWSGGCGTRRQFGLGGVLLSLAIAAVFAVAAIRGGSSSRDRV